MSSFCDFIWTSTALRGVANAWQLMLGVMLVVVLSGLVERQARGQNREFTYSYSNLFDGELNTQGNFDDFDQLVAIEEALALWSGVARLDFVEIPDAGPLPTASDGAYQAAGPIADIRMGHHPLDGNVLAHAFPPGQSGIAQDVHFDSSNRRWGESLFFSTAAHELGHALDVPHIEGVVSLMNAQLGGNNILTTPGESTLFQPEIEAIQNRWGAGQGTVRTTRSWTANQSTDWSVHANWAEGFRPTRYSDANLDVSGAIAVSRGDFQVNSLTFGSGRNQLEINSGGRLDVAEALSTGRQQGGDSVLNSDQLKYFVPSDDSVAATWFLPDFDDSQWQSGTVGVGFERGIGYENLIQTDLEDAMFGINSSAYTRIEFDWSAEVDVESMRLNMRYDDGFVAYLNGTRLTGANGPATVRWNSTATASRNDADAVTAATFEVTDLKDNLVVGRNVLAIQALNNRVTSSDLLLVPDLLVGANQNDIVVNQGDLIVGGDLRLAETTRSSSTLRVEAGTAEIRGNIVGGSGNATVQMRGGTLRVDGGFASEVLVAEDAQARVLVPTDDSLGEAWRTATFDDSEWREAQNGFGFERSTGFEALIATDLESELFDINGTFYTRFGFQIDETEKVDELLLDVKYDDGFVAFLNGQAVASANAPNELTWDSRASRASDESAATRFETFDLSDFTALLVQGENTLAIQGLNSSPNSSDLLLVPQLTARQRSGTLTVDSLEYEGGQLSGVEHVRGTFRHLAGVYSPGHDATRTIGVLEITGDYQMAADATLQIDLELDEANGTMSRRDSLSVDGIANLTGTFDLRLTNNDQPFNSLLAPATAGTSEVITLMNANSIVGTFAELTLNGEAWENHRGDGLFWFIDTMPDRIELRAFQAIVGDSDGNGVFSSGDLVNVFMAGQYEDDILLNSDWTTGDWNGDAEFDSGDLVIAFREAAYLPLAARQAAAVPEPTGIAVWLLLTLGLIKRRKPTDACAGPAVLTQAHRARPQTL